MSGKKGRPYGSTKENKRDAVISVRTLADLKTVIDDLAEASGKSTARFLEDLLIEKARSAGRWP